jgi:peptidoglycan hydrolase-like protein with peptidoglycan-binding domain
MNTFIRKVQQALNDRGYGPLKIDGRAGPKTTKAIAAFQKDAGLTADGLVGPLTENRLFLEQLSVISLDSDGATAHFSRAEFACDCGGAYCSGYPAAMELGLLLKLEALRNTLNTPVVITSGLRCETRNREVGGIPDSRHLIGQAADLYAPGIDINQVAGVAGGLGLTTILYPEEGFVHCQV